MDRLLRKIAFVMIALAYMSATAQHVGGLHAAVLAGENAAQYAVMDHAHHAEAGHSPSEDATSHEGTPSHGMKMVGCGLACAGTFAPTDPASARMAHPAHYPATGGPGLAMVRTGVEPPPPRT